MTKFAFYCSGHGFGHATRVSALTTELLAAGHSVALVTNAPLLPFAAVLPPSELPPDVIPPVTDVQLPAYATYRNRNVDAGIVQPKAYDVDRKATYEVLKSFLEQREQTLEEEAAWLKEAEVECVLSDATFLGCAAASQAGLPSIIVSNFTFDSCYSYLSHPSLLPLFPSSSEPSPEPPIPHDLLSPLVDRSIADYRCANLLLRLPGAIPIPAFDTDVPLPSGTWVNEDRTSFTPEILDMLARPTNAVPRQVVDVPMVVRPPSADVYKPEFRKALLEEMGVPEHLQGEKILLVSFGGQSIPRPRTRPPTPLSTPLMRSTSSSSRSNGYLDVAPSTEQVEAGAGLLPKGWIAIVCGLGSGNEIRNDLPAGFFAPSGTKDVHVPDLCATADVLLGKLGYGTCSETIAVKTPFVYVPRPLFIEEFGLVRLMRQRGVSLSLSRDDFEAGRWEHHILEAWEQGREAKEKQRKSGYVDERAAATIRGEIEKFLVGWAER